MESPIVCWADHVGRIASHHRGLSDVQVIEMAVASVARLVEKEDAQEVEKGMKLLTALCLMMREEADESLSKVNPVALTPASDGWGVRRYVQQKNERDEYCSWQEAINREIFDYQLRRNRLVTMKALCTQVFWERAISKAKQRSEANAEGIKCLEDMNQRCINFRKEWEVKARKPRDQPLEER